MDSQKKFYLGSFIGQMATNVTTRYRKQEWITEVGKQFLVVPPFYPDNK